MRGLRPAGAGERRRRRGGGNLSHGGEKRAEARGESEAALLYRGAYEAGGEYRNLAENPADQRGEVEAYPHATANVETRNESGFAARIPSAPRKADRRKRAPYFMSAVSLTTK